MYSAVPQTAWSISNATNWSITPKEMVLLSLPELAPENSPHYTNQPTKT